MAKDEETEIIAFDLSLTNSGYAVGKVTDRDLEIIEVGSIKTKYKKGEEAGRRLLTIAKAVKELYQQYPDAKKVVKERSFSNGRVKATQQIFKVVGVWELMSFLAGHDEFTDIAPNSVKKEVAGHGRANKKQVAEKVKELTGIEPDNDDESDAIAVLITYCMQKDLIDL